VTPNSDVLYLINENNPAIIAIIIKITPTGAASFCPEKQILSNVNALYKLRIPLP